MALKKALKSTIHYHYGTKKLAALAFGILLFHSFPLHCTSTLSPISFPNSSVKKNTVLAKATNTKKHSKILSQVEAREKLLLDHAEEIWNTTKHLWEKTNAVLRLAYGSALLTCGCLFPTQIYAISVFKTSGWPTVKDGVLKIRDKYIEGRRVVKEELPNLLEAKETLAQVYEEVDRVKVALKKMEKEKDQVLKSLQKELQQAKGNGDKGNKSKQKLKTSDLDAGIEELKQDLKSLNSKIRELNKAAQSVTHIVEAVDPQYLTNILQGMYLSCATFLAGASSSSVSMNIKAVTYGANIAETVSKGTEHVFGPVSQKLKSVESMAPETFELFQSGVLKFVQANCVLLSVLQKDLANQVNGCILGATIVVDAVGDIKEQFAPEFFNTIPSFQLRSACIAALTTAGLVYQAKLQTKILMSGVPENIQKTLGPLINQEIKAVEMLKKQGVQMDLDKVASKVTSIASDFMKK